MKRKNIVGLIALVAIVAAVIFAGCVEEETPVPTPSPTATTVVPSVVPSITITSKSGDEVSWREFVEGTSEGVYGSDLNIYVLVYPTDAGGPWWVQPDVDVLRDGSWETNCYFGRDPKLHPEDKGAHFRICAIMTTEKLREGQQLQKLPDYVVKSETVKVTRD
ncbi:MAG: hypothetical protein OCU12_04420 [Methanophagales archaeon]|nr:hypothetical protein [Methanophagales archaeon]